MQVQEVGSSVVPATVQFHSDLSESPVVIAHSQMPLFEMVPFNTKAKVKVAFHKIILALLHPLFCYFAVDTISFLSLNF